MKIFITILVTVLAIAVYVVIGTAVAYVELKYMKMSIFDEATIHLKDRDQEMIFLFVSMWPVMLSFGIVYAVFYLIPIKIISWYDKKR